MSFSAPGGPNGTAANCDGPGVSQQIRLPLDSLAGLGFFWFFFWNQTRPGEEKENPKIPSGLGDIYIPPSLPFPTKYPVLRTKASLLSLPYVAGVVDQSDFAVTEEGKRLLIPQ